LEGLVNRITANEDFSTTNRLPGQYRHAKRQGLQNGIDAINPYNNADNNRDIFVLQRLYSNLSALLVAGFVEYCTRDYDPRVDLLGIGRSVSTHT